ncbi:hypothetical protein E4T47_03715 [Aureobasidium subglaciale]|nr:hypothetical protein E4T47_03715 [Aureobasidium subglaciale]
MKSRVSDLAVSAEDIQDLINHIVLPPKLPHEEDKQPVKIEENLLSIAQDVISSMRDRSSSVWMVVRSMLLQLKTIRLADRLQQDVLEQKLSQISPGGCIALHLKAHNCSLIIRRTDTETIIFECFEVAACSQATMSATGRLVREFPGCAFSWSSAMFFDHYFLTQFSTFLCRLQAEPVDYVSMSRVEGHNRAPKDWNSASPEFVTGCLMAMLRANGSSEQVTPSRKHIRDDILAKQIRIPWRRSSFWLFLRVSVLRALDSQLEASKAQHEYKKFMIQVVAKLLHLVLDMQPTPDNIAMVHSKLARRVFKFEQMFGDISELQIDGISSRARESLRAIWDKDVNAPVANLLIPTEDWEVATLLTLHRSRQVLLEASSPPPTLSSVSAFIPPPRQSQNKKQLPSMRNLKPDGSRIVLLTTIEQWVEDHLTTWTPKSAQPCTPELFDNLADLIVDYSSMTSAQYAHSPRATSLALLTIVELWVALDKMCCLKIRLLKKFSPEIPFTLLRTLLAPKIRQMHRLEVVEKYIHSRGGQADSNMSSVFARPTPTSFSVCYFDSTPSLEEMRQRIQTSDQQKREQKLAELHELRSKYDLLVKEADDTEHAFAAEDGGQKIHQVDSCRKCELEDAARELEIAVHEDALPSDEVQGKSAVFEMAIPVAFAAWRDATCLIIHDLGRQSRKAEHIMRMSPALRDYGPLKQYMTVFSRRSRLTMGSCTKPYLFANKQKVHLPIADEKVCVENGLTLDLWDTQRECWPSAIKDVISFKHHCTLGIPAGCYQKLTWAQETFTHTPNDVMSRQDDCDDSLEIREYVAFCTLRAGERIQYMNILRELGCGNLNHNQPATTVLIQQALWEAGTPSQSVLREAHLELRESNFCKQLLLVLRCRLDAIKNNWQERYAMMTVIDLCLRALSITSDEVLQEGLLRLLTDTRSACLDWCRELQTYMHEGSAQLAVQEKTVEHLLGAALLCFSTFDVESEHLRQVLASADDLAIAVEAQALIHGHTPAIKETLPPLLQQSLIHSQRIAQSLESHILGQFTHVGSGLTKVTQQLCNEMKLESRWKPILGTSWVCNKTIPMDGAKAQVVHYNLVGGDLLVDGKPLSKVPHHIKSDPLFQQIFGAAVLQVVASDIEGMEFQVTQPVHNHTIHFTSRNGKLCIRALVDGRVLQALPPAIFENDLPLNWITKYTHWMDVETHEIEFRSRCDPWTSSEASFKLTFSSLDFLEADCQLHNSNEQLIDPKSPPGRAVQDILSVLDQSTYCHIIRDTRTPQELKVYLPRYNLHFRVTSLGQVSSLEFNAVVDLDQNIGTLFGLHDKLVLVEPALKGRPEKRYVLIPYGPIEIERTQHHVKVTIQKGEDDKQRFIIYTLDEHLGKLQHSFDTTSQLLRAYLHAITSFSLPDPLTGRTGSEEAISILQEASLYSATPLKTEERVLINLIASLSPIFDWHTFGNKSAQIAYWHPNLPSSSQDHAFYQSAEKVFNHRARAEALHDLDGLDTKGLRSGGDRMLAKRAGRRKVSTSKFTPLCESTDGDNVYEGRDRNASSSQATEVFQIANLIRDWPSKLDVSRDLVALFESWSQVNGFHSEFHTISLQKLAQTELNKTWGSLYDLCRRSIRSTSTYELMFTFCPIVWGIKTEKIVHLRTLLAFAFSDAFDSLEPPANYKVYDLIFGSSQSPKQIEKIITDIAKVPRKKGTPAQRARHEQVKRSYKTEHSALLTHITSWWHRNSIPLPTTGYDKINDQIAAIITECESRMAIWRQNHLLLKHIQAVNVELQKMQGSYHSKRMPVATLPAPTGHYTAYSLPSQMELLQDADRARSFISPGGPPQLSISPEAANIDAEELRNFLERMPRSDQPVEDEYLSKLEAGLERLDEVMIDQNSTTLPPSMTPLRILVNYTAYVEHIERTMTMFARALDPSTPAQKILQAADLWPRSTKYCLLQQLSRSRIASSHVEWKLHLLKLAEGIAKWQRSERQLRYLDSGNISALRKELSCKGRIGWEAKEYPSWLLLEIENNITIRPIQAQVALEMMNPSSQENSVLQLNMGEGKSSVIIPMIVIVQADGTRLPRVIGLKPLLRQTQILLTQILGGLLDQPVIHIPFSRQTEINATTVECLDRVLKDCKQDRGVLIALPEEALSMTLMARERMAMNSQLSVSILDLLRWLDANCRDVLDESDEILGPQVQLIYPMGTQQMLDGKSDRWKIAQAVLARLGHHAQSLSVIYPHQLRADLNGKAFPTIKILAINIFDKVVDLIVEDVLEGRLEGIGFDFYSQETKVAVRTFISRLEPSEDCLAVIDRDCAGTFNWSALLILRGLLAHGVLQFVVQQKRWHVEYGLNPGRCLTAVPYRAKGVPSANAEFGHPDVSVLLTCLSYYYTGLREDQIRTCFSLLSKDSNGRDIYATWASDCQDLHHSLVHYDSVNLNDTRMCEQKLFPQMQYNTAIIGYYLNQVVFPKEGKEYSKKISASGWDIPSTSKDTNLLTTGFSGTNDNRSLLPYSIKQQDLDNLQHTSAHVINLILHPDNSRYIQVVASDGGKLDVAGLLARLLQEEPQVNVIIDVGAQVLELSNLELVRQWLNLHVQAPAAIFFDHKDEAMVLDRSGRITPLRLSLFAKKLDGCLFYLDEMHTRGIDLPIPINSRAVVTLGPRLSKDRLIQACMRMRHLINGHSLCFLAPPEVHHSICSVEGLGGDDLRSSDVLTWCIKHTCEAMATARLLRATLGLEYVRQQGVKGKYFPSNRTSRDITQDTEAMKAFCKKMQENELTRLEERYGPQGSEVNVLEKSLDRTSCDPTMEHLVLECASVSQKISHNKCLETEQEREVATEIERQCHVQRPPRNKPLVHKVSDGLKAYIKTGTYQSFIACEAEKALKLFQKTSVSEAGQTQMINPQTCRVSISKDFAYSVELSEDAQLDDYLRPVHWVLSSSKTKRLLVISPFELNELLHVIKASEHVRLHTFAARLTKKMLNFGNMDFYTFPETSGCDEGPVRELELFAGSLYVPNAHVYGKYCDFLGLLSPSRRSTVADFVKDGYVEKDARASLDWKDCPFQKNPLPFWKQALTLRNYGQGFEYTHMGSILNGKALTKDAFKDENQAGGVDTAAHNAEDEMDTTPG